MSSPYPGTITLGELLDEIARQSGQPVEDVRDWRVMVDDQVNELLIRRVESVVVNEVDRIVILALWKPVV